MKIGIIILIVVICIFQGLKAKNSDNILAVGQVAPNFTLISENQKKVSLKDYKGKQVVIYFFPKAETPG
ncbi:MAG: redoxin domain-containing protein [Candidatus Marinimicrobia bacterium]|jgi:peroxiredoxin Q/BCP|nr:redoxin domain-containing protein [Candidatus Neomarinimicrobiota bacterium]MBT3937569.1 redoxin domain-containing protein [Candidatus Neomarinimicrobiota bacterium]MBT3960724.1 redoxin domain-containing protein [Candidatus Neomarinimicrobiota bacterium]MBT4382914.1 redoxin domain-containing protein [Candidatus Neomarinimicrobiota bacterium]MBT4635114.1 redoxin domain-containing protein [Candidatus Neomarinimicrobiota bacterium]